MVLGFDAPFAHPTSSFNEPVAAPDVEPDEGTLIQVCFSEAWLPLVLGSLSQLQLQSTWLGDSDAVLLAQGRATNLKGLFATPVCAVSEVEAPYWDTDEDVDDNAPADDQEWYGKVEDNTVPPDELTWQEDAAIWAFTGLIAVATFAEAGPFPAIAFRTIAPKFVVAIRTGDFGRIIRLFVDGSEAARVEDDGSGDIVEMPVVADPSLETHQIYITAGVA